MDIVTAETIGKKSKALKHCDKLLNQIDKNGSAKVKLNCTGVEFVVHKDDAIYCRIQRTKYALLDEIRSFELTTRSQRAIEQQQPTRRTAPAPVGAAPESEVLSPEEQRKAKQREYSRRYYAKKKAQAQQQQLNFLDE
ncbi:MAG: hypothetical protein NC489_45890 [Ruminococcus flavefaciens]|nr:hypothetical protein [Ruminococcus flavefaciens]